MAALGSDGAADAAAALAETPEIYGAEHLLTRRAISREVGEKLVDKVHWWERHAAKHNMEIDNNPSAGNKVGGLTTILEKSLGAVAKGGSTPLMGVFDYAEPGEFTLLRSAPALFYSALYSYDEGLWQGPLYVVLDEGSASAAEHFATLLNKPTTLTYVDFQIA